MTNPDVTIKYEAPSVPSETPNMLKGDIFKPKQVKGFYNSHAVPPSAPPANFMEQVQIIYTGGSIYLYIYDFAIPDWRSIQF